MAPMQIKIKLQTYDWLIVIMICSIIISGPFWGAFTPLRILGVLMLVVVILKSKYLYQIKKLLYFFSFFVLYAIISSLWAFDKANAIIDLFQLICYIGVFVGIYYCSLRAQKPCRAILFGWFLFTLMNLSVAYWEVLTGNHLENGMYQSDNMAIGMDGIKSYLIYSAVTYGNYNSLSIVMTICYYMIILYIAYTSSRFFKIILILVIFLILGIEIINNSRGCMTACALGIFPLFKAIKTDQIAKYILYIVFFCVVIFAIYEFGDAIYFLIDRKVTARTGGFWGDDRWKLWASSIEVAKNYFFIGSGPGSQIYELKSIHALNHYAHNMWLQTLVEYGLFITILLFYSIFCFAKKALRTKDELIRLIGIFLLISWPVLTIVDEGYMKPVHWVFFSSLLSLFHRRNMNTIL